MDWNPGAPNVLGLQMLPRARGTLPTTDAPNQGVAIAQSLTPAVTETITAVHIPTIPNPYSGGRLIWEALNAGQESFTGLGSTVCLPNASPARSNVDGSGFSGTDIWQNVTTPANYIFPTVNGGWVELEFATAGAVPAGKRVIGAWLFLTVGQVGSPGFITVEANTAGTRRPWAYKTVATDMPGFTWDVAMIQLDLEPVGLQPWTISDIDALDGPNSRIRFTFNGTGSELWQVTLTVVYADENRQAAGSIELPASSRRWREITPRKPDGTIGWDKVASSPVTMVLRMQQGYGVTIPMLAVPYIETADPQHPLVGNVDLYPTALVGTGYYLSSPSASPAAITAGSITDLEPGHMQPRSLTRVIPISLSTAAGQSADSQPYALIADLTVTATETVEQEIQATADEYGGVQFPVMPDTSTGYPGDLTIELIRRSDSALIATAVVTAVDAMTSPFVPGNQWRLVTASFDTSPTLAATQHALRFSTTAGTWTLPALTGDDGLVTITGNGAGSFGGTTDVATFNGADLPAADVPVLAFVAPDPVTNFAAAATAVPTGASGIGCPVTSIGGVTLSWTPTALAGEFLHYEIQRRDTVDTTWQPIAVITDEAVDEFIDVEARLGVQSCYRIRAVRTDGIGSAWSADECATAPVSGCALTFTSNEAPEMSVAYADTYDRVAQRDYEFPEAGEVVTRRLYGRDFQVTFRPLERRGVTFRRNLLVRGAVAGGVTGPPAVDALRDLAAATLSYVTVRDEAGNRWYGSITVPELRVRQPGGFHWVTLTFVETTGTPSTPDAVAP